MRGTAAGESVVSQAQTKAWDERYDRVFKRCKSERGRFIWDAAQGKLVRAEDYHASRAVDAPVMVGRHHENTVAPDGTDISTRAKRRAWMAKTGMADAADFKDHWKRKSAERARFYETGFTTADVEKQTKDEAAAILGRIVEQRQKDYDHERSGRENARRERGRGYDHSESLTWPTKPPQ